MQAASDIFLGWASAGETDFYVRQLRDMKGTVDTTSLRARGLVSYAKLCGWALARAHARSGAAAQIAGYAGNGGVLDDAISSIRRRATPIRPNRTTPCSSRRCARVGSWPRPGSVTDWRSWTGVTLRARER